MVIENHPRLSDGTPFPTLFWLTCPVLVGGAGRVEAAGRMRGVNDRLAATPALRARLADALARYLAKRDGHDPLPGSGAPPGGGPERVKCLHAHLAHELADPPNPVGAWALSATGFPDCRAPCVGCG